MRVAVPQPAFVPSSRTAPGWNATSRRVDHGQSAPGNVWAGNKGTSRSTFGSFPAKTLRCALFALVAIALSVATRAAAVQQHGLVFEEWVRDTFFDGYKPLSATQKWDVPAAVNKTHGGVPVNPKATKNRTPVDLGDALRQFDIAEPFLLVVGFWEQNGADKKFVNIIAPRIEPAV